MATLFEMEPLGESGLKLNEAQERAITHGQGPLLVIAGAGNDVVPLVDIVTLLGWHVTVVDGRPHHATRERFPKADRVVVAKAKEVLGQLHTDVHTLFVLMTHNYNYDLALLSQSMLTGADLTNFIKRSVEMVS